MPKMMYVRGRQQPEVLNYRAVNKSTYDVLISVGMVFFVIGMMLLASAVK